ncbi:MAG: sugar phosphate isomerase/epimerase family protein [Christensenellaceae bacterium]
MNEDALKRIGELGVPHAEVFFSANMEYTPEFIHGLNRICTDEGVSVVSVHAFTTVFEPQLFSYHPRQYEEALRVYYNVLEAAAMLHAEIYVFHGPIWLKTARKLALDFDYVGERTAFLAEEAKSYGIKLAYENVHWCWYQYPGFAKELVEKSGADNLYFTLDMKQAAQSGYEVMDFIDDMGERLAHIHLCDYIKKENGEIVSDLPFNGQMDWHTLRDKLRDIRYDGTLMLEVYSSDYKTDGELMENYNKVNRFFE